MKRVWDEGAVNQDLPFVEDTKRIVDTTQSTVQVDKSQNAKAILRQELEALGWQYSGSATLKANLLLRRKYLVFESTAKLDADDKYRLKVVLSRGSVSEYKLMKSVFKHVSDRDIMRILGDWVTYSKTGKLAVLLVIVLLIVIPILGLTVCQSLPRDELATA